MTQIMFTNYQHMMEDLFNEYKETFPPKKSHYNGIEINTEHHLNIIYDFLFDPCYRKISYESLGKKHNISGSRVRQILDKARRKFIWMYRKKEDFKIKYKLLKPIFLNSDSVYEIRIRLSTLEDILELLIYKN